MSWKQYETVTPKRQVVYGLNKSTIYPIPDIVRFGYSRCAERNNKKWKVIPGICCKIDCISWKKVDCENCRGDHQSSHFENTIFAANTKIHFIPSLEISKEEVIKRLKNML